MNAKYNFREFQAAIKRVAHATATDDTRPVLQCVQVIGSKHGTKLHAADGFRAAFHKIAPADGAPAFEVLLDPAAVKSIVSYKLLKKDDPELVLDFESAHLLVNGKALPGGFYTEGTYPEVNAVKPVKCATSLRVYPLPLLQALKTARVFAREGSNVVRLHVTESLLLQANSEETGESISVASTYRRSGPELLIAFNVDFLIDCLKQAGADPVKFEFNKASQPGLITFQDGYQEVVMPMHLCVSGTPKPQRAEELTEREYNGESYVWPNRYTNCHPDPAALHGYIPAWYDPPQPREEEPRAPQPYIPDDWFTSTPEPDAVIYDLTGATADIAESEVHWKTIRTPRITLELSNPRPVPGNHFPIVVYDPNFNGAPIPVEIPVPVERPNRYALYDDD